MSRVGGAALLLALLCGCTRKAPGPGECGRFAAASLGLSGREIELFPAARDAYEERMTRCLTTPGYRGVIRCAEVTGDARRCEAEFDRRRFRELR